LGERVGGRFLAEGEEVRESGNGTDHALDVGAIVEIA
jgi:hypothetical protein